MRALVTGAGGFVGQWLCKALLRDGHAVAGVTLGLLPEPGVLSAQEISAIHWRGMDLRPGAAGEQRSFRALVDHVKPDALFHLAGVAFVPSAGADPGMALGVNVGGLVQVVAGLKEPRAAGVCDPTLLVIGSGEQYGAHAAAALPLLETAECRPHSFYAATKVAQEAVAFTAWRTDRLKVIATRSFNHSGPGQAPSFLLPSLVARAKAAKASGAPVTIGNTDVIRDFLHVEDVVTAYISLVSRGAPGEVYNVCSGEGVRVGDLAAEVLARVGITAPLQVDPALVRAVDVPALVGSNAKVRAATGWTPRRSRSDIIADLLNAPSPS